MNSVIKIKIIDIMSDNNKDAVTKDEKQQVPNWMKRSVASNLATVSAVTLFYPLEVIKTRS